MARDVQTKQIGSSQWSVQPLPATEGVRVLSRLLKIVGPAIAKSAKGIKGGSGLLDAEIDGSAIGDAVDALVSGLDEQETLSLIQRMMAGVRKDGHEVAPTFATEFMGDYLTLIKVLAFVVEVNYGSFFGEGGLGRFKASQKPPASG